MASQEEIMTRLTELVEKMEHIPVVDGVKLEVAAASLLMDCCFAMAVSMADEEAEQLQITLAMFSSITAGAISQPPRRIRMGDGMSPGAIIG